MSRKSYRIERVTDSWMWVKGSDGHASVSATFAAGAFWITSIVFLLSAFETLGPITLRPFDVAACAVYLSPILGLYFGRRYTEAVHPKKDEATCEGDEGDK